jgi:hypothetical protein
MKGGARLYYVVDYTRKSNIICGRVFVKIVDIGRNYFYKDGDVFYYA